MMRTYARVRVVFQLESKIVIEPHDTFDSINRRAHDEATRIVNDKFADMAERLKHVDVQFVGLDIPSRDES